MQLFKLGKKLIRHYYQMHPGFNRLQTGVDDAKTLGAKSLIRSMREEGIVDDLNRVEFKVFSQFGEDGIIQYLIRNVDTAQENFIEFGSWDYSEANTRLWVINDGWSGLLIDGSASNVEHIKRDSIYWQHDLKAVSAFITRNNINDLIRENGFEGEIGILSIDIDGVDYWVWERISVVRPVIVIVEYNSIFGFRQPVVVPYDSKFYRYDAHYSGLYWGASLNSLCCLGERKGYAVVGCTSAA